MAAFDLFFLFQFLIFYLSVCQPDLQAHIIGDANADTRHFMEQPNFTPPLESSVSIQSKLVLAKWKDEAKHTLPHPVWTAEAVDSVK